MLKLIIAAAWLCAMAVGARSADLTGEQIKDLLAGATVEIDTPLGTKLPVHCGRDGRLLGEAGSLAWYLGGATDRGRWWVVGDQVCLKWNRWLSSEPQCLRLRKEGRLIRWRMRDGNSGTATVSVPPGPKLATVVPPLLLGPSKASAPPQTPPAPPKAPAPVADPKHPPGAVADDAGKPPEPEVKPAVEEPPEKAPAPPKAVLKEGEPPEKLAEPKRATVPLFKVANVRRDDVLNVRSRPSADSDIVGTLPPGSRGIAITSACRAQWCPVKHLATSGWVNSTYLTPEGDLEGVPEKASPPGSGALHDSPEAPRSCLTTAARALLDRIEREFGPVQVISTCRPGATIRGTWRPSRHASGNAVDFKAGTRKDAIIAWLIANHRRGGTMTYAGMDHIHVDIGPYFVSIAGGPRWASWRGGQPDLAGAR
jgi:hypothetical protein